MARLKLVIKKRLVFILIIYTFLILALLVRVGYIQFAQGNFLRKQAFLQQNSGRIIRSRRGTIYDRNGKELAVSASVETISVNPQELKNNDIDMESVAQKLSEILQMDKNKIYKIITKNTIFEFVKQKVDKEVGGKVRKWRNEEGITGLYIDEDSKRFYPNRSLASHVLGFTSIDNRGLDGIEKTMEKYLKGVPGKIISEVDGLGREIPFNEEKHISPRDGWNVVLTIDETIQYFTEKVLENAINEYKLKRGAAAIIMDPRNGDILAMVSMPSFDPNNPRAAPEGVDDSEWTGKTREEVDLLSSTVWRNKVVQNPYEPGSTFKAVTTAAGLEEGVVTPDTMVNDRTITISGHNIDCWKPNFHGEETFTEAVYNSCNPVFVKVALELGLDRFYNYMKAFGFYSMTDIRLPGEALGMIHEKPREIDMAVAAFGQRFTITPVQLVTAYSAIANGGTLVKPRLVKELTDQEGSIIKKIEPVYIRNVISRQTSETVRTILEGVVSEGTGKNAYVKGYRVAGKTGTSQTTETISEGRYIASFAAMAPADNPIITVLVILDHPQSFSYYGGVIAAPVAGELIEDILDYIGLERRYTEKDKEMMREKVIVPDLRNKTVEQAKIKLARSKLKNIIRDNENGGDLIKDQTPKPGAVLYENSVVILYTYDVPQEKTVTVPDLSDKTISEATETLHDIGLNIKVDGVGMAVKQSIEAGTRIKEGEIIEVKFLFMDTKF